MNGALYRSIDQTAEKSRKLGEIVEKSREILQKPEPRLRTKIILSGLCSLTGIVFLISVLG